MLGVRNQKRGPAELSVGKTLRSLFMIEKAIPPCTPGFPAAIMAAEGVNFT